MGYIYGLYCTCHPDSGIRYIGKSLRPVASRLREHRRDSKKYDWPVYRWILKHGQENIQVIQLHEAMTLEDLNALEIAEIASRENLLNIQSGGGGAGWKWTPERYIRMKEYWSTAETQGRPGETNPAAKLTEMDAIAVLVRLNSGESPSRIALDYPISRTTVSNMKMNRLWKSIDRSQFPNLVQNGEGLGPRAEGYWHGTASGYDAHRCRCEPCKEAGRAHRRAKADGPMPNDLKHGTANAYSAYGCRCDECREFKKSTRK